MKSQTNRCTQPSGQSERCSPGVQEVYLVRISCFSPSVSATDSSVSKLRLFAIEKHHFADLEDAFVRNQRIASCGAIRIHKGNVRRKPAQTNRLCRRLREFTNTRLVLASERGVFG